MMIRGDDDVDDDDDDDVDDDDGGDDDLLRVGRKRCRCSTIQTFSAKWVPLRRSFLFELFYLVLNGGVLTLFLASGSLRSEKQPKREMPGFKTWTHTCCFSVNDTFFYGLTSALWQFHLA